ncbi:hypothetical protein [Klebsiella pasteurii]|uniref:hypothetical protein n=1 Tax=Klebsiella pasteurii TaxID=2587529 RepID=UPI001C7D07F0|nr:hypothetical protein [Klebsiella pasteurii]
MQTVSALHRLRHRIGFHIHLTRRAVRRLAVNDFRHIRTHCTARRLRQVAARQTLHRRRYRLRHLLVISTRIGGSLITKSECKHLGKTDD